MSSCPDRMRATPRAEVELRERERQLQSLADNTPDVIARFDRELRHVFVNAAVEAATGIAPAMFLGKTNRELGLPTELCDTWEHELRQVFESGQPRAFEFKFETPNGTRYWSSRLVREHAHDGTDYVLCVSHDVSGLKQAEQALREADRRKDLLLAMIAHELRNPLAPIRTGIEVLKLDPDATRRSQTLAMMERQLAHTTRLVDDLVDVSSIAQGNLTLNRRPVCMQDVLQDAVEAAQPALRRASHELLANLPAERIWVHGDPERLIQVFGNLLTNAIKYTPDAGRITLDLRADGKAVQVHVQDSGVGIAPHMIDSIFDMFTQVSETRTLARGGLGIGLSLVQRLVAMHGGSVRAESPGEGRGSTFVVTLPEIRG